MATMRTMMTARAMVMAAGMLGSMSLAWPSCVMAGPAVAVQTGERVTGSGPTPDWAAVIAEQERKIAVIERERVAMPVALALVAMIGAGLIGSMLGRMTERASQKSKTEPSGPTPMVRTTVGGINPPPPLASERERPVPPTARPRPVDLLRVDVMVVDGAGQVKGTWVKTVLDSDLTLPK